MKKSDLKQLIKPLVKECIHEVLLEEGLLSNVVSEVAKGLQTQSLVVESRTLPPQHKIKAEVTRCRRPKKEVAGCNWQRFL